MAKCYMVDVRYALPEREEAGEMLPKETISERFVVPQEGYFDRIEVVLRAKLGQSYPTDMSLTITEAGEIIP